MSEAPAVDAYLPALERGGAALPETSVAGAVRRYLEAAREHLGAVHRELRSGRATNQTASEQMDRLVRHLFALAEAGAYRDAALPHRLAVAAVGGYGREEMAIYSDVDLLFLHPEPLTNAAAAVAEQVQYWLWDAGLTVGCAIRTIRETCELARRDASVATAVLAARRLAGDPQLYREFDATWDREVFADPARFVEQVSQLRAERHAKFGESLYLLQPNLKEGAGGLRDYHAARWAMRAVHPEGRDLGAFASLGLLTPAELEELIRALDFLWLVRNELHLISGRRNDRMAFGHQEEIARSLGYAEIPGAELPVERFMGDYYRHARVVESVADLVLEQCLARSRPPGPVPPARVVEDDFRVVGDHLEIPSLEHLRQHPIRLLTAFAVAQAHDVSLSRTALRMVRESLDLVDDRFRRDPEVAAVLWRILGAEHRVFRTLTALNQVGLLGRYLPEWEHIVCRWQHVMYHTYTVDVHTTFLVEELRRLWRGKYERAFPNLTEQVRNVSDRVVLYLGCLFHDVGKGRGGDHSRRGVEIARRCLRRLGLEPDRIERVVFLVAEHLTMSHLAQRRDLSDPRLIVEFARLVGDRENLRNLYLLTFADTRASSPEAWTEWKGRLLHELFERTSEFLETGGDDPARAIEQVEAQVARVQQEGRLELRALGVSEGRIDAYFGTMPRRYFVSHTPQEIARHARLFLSFRPERGTTMAVRDLPGAVSELILCTRDIHGLHAKVAGSLTSRGLNILYSTVYTSRRGLALEVYLLATPPGGAAERQLAWKEFEQTLHDVLAGRRDVAEAIRRRRQPVGPVSPPSRKPPSVLINNRESDFYTIVDLTANDRLGLLYELTSAIAEQGLEIYISKATTVLDQVADTFYLKDAERKKITDPVRLKRLHDTLLAVLRGEPPAEPGS